MIKRILNNLKTHHKIPQKIFSKFEFAIKKRNYNKNFFENKQNKIFQKLNLDRELGLNKLKIIKDKYNFLQREMSSEHEVLFSSLSIKFQESIQKILEIGTFDGANAFLLSVLFDNSDIETIDINKDKSDFINFYNRVDKIEEFVNSRKEIISKSKRINFKEMNSIRLCNLNKKYDLIWIDGAHGYPMICIDIINSLKLINDNGIVMCDDVFIKKVNSDKMYTSNTAHEILMELKKENLINFDLIYKRLDAESNCLENKRNFVATLQKTISSK